MISQIKTFLLWCLIVLLLSVFCSSCGGDAVDITQQRAAIDSCRVVYRAARAAQTSGKYAEALPIYKRCVAFDATDTQTADSIAPIVIDALMQMMNTYQSKGEPVECANYFDTLVSRPSRLLSGDYRRDMMVIYGYALSRTERMSQAETVMLDALKLPLRNATPERLFRDYAYAAAVFYPNLQYQQQVVEWCRLGLEQAQMCSNTSGAQWLISLLGSVYRRSGRLADAINMFNESAAVAMVKGDILGVANAYSAIADVCLAFNVLSYARQYADMAINEYEQLDNVNPMLITQSYIVLGRVMYRMGRIDSVVVMLDKAERYAASLPYNSGASDIDFMRGMIMLKSAVADTVAVGTTLLERVAADGSPTLRARAYAGLAEYYLQSQSDVRRGEAMTDSMYALAHHGGASADVHQNYRTIINHYIGSGNIAKASRHVSDLLDAYDALSSDSLGQTIAENLVTMSTRQLDEQLRIAAVELHNERLKWVSYGGSLILVIIILCIVIFYRRRVERLNRKLLDSKLNELSESLNTAIRERQKAEASVASLLSHEQSRAQIEAVSPVLIKEQGEGEFYRRFTLLYPLFITELHKRVPGLGKREELLCMLIALKLDNARIADIMAISHSSVNMARHRLRKKLALDKEQSLEQVIANLLTAAD